MLHVAQRVYNLLDELQEESAERTCILVAHNGIGRMVHSYFRCNPEVFSVKCEKVGLIVYIR